VQAYCATSLVAVSVAASSLLTGECDVALAGGVAVEVPHRVGYLYEPGGISSSDGRCRSFDATGEGTPHGTGNGLGVVVLRRLGDAVADRDRIYGVIRGWAVNHDGAAKAAFTAPGVAGQAGVVAEALAAAGLEPADVDYLEAHGTGTALGDTIEVAALQQVFPDSRLAIGSTKPNFGHLDRAAGVTGLMKVALSLTHDEIPPTINHERPNEQLARSEGRIEVVTSSRPWPRGARPRRAGVSAFGLGGANAHVVVEEPPLLSSPDTLPPREHHVLVWSARTEEAADATGERLAAMLADRSDVDIADVAFTLQVGRKVFTRRRAVVVSSTEDAVAALRSDRVRSRVEAARGRSVALTGPADVVGEVLTWVRAGADVALEVGPDDRAADVLAQLWLSGVDIDWHAYHEGRSPRKVAVPQYGFQRTSYWIDPPTDAAGRRAI
jgi:acyl transferase domain-containing protein